MLLSLRAGAEDAAWAAPGHLSLVILPDRTICRLLAKGQRISNLMGIFLGSILTVLQACSLACCPDRLALVDCARLFDLDGLENRAYI